MPRLPRVVVPGLPHHITQRGNGRRHVFFSDRDRLVYLDLLRNTARLHSFSVAGYCLMSNHIHLVAVPREEESLARGLRDVHGRYASYLNAQQAASGHLWQGRFYSCPLEVPLLWTVLRYVERNPVRAGIVDQPDAFPWSSASAHCSGLDSAGLLDFALWRGAWTPAEWRSFVAGGSPGDEEQTAEIRVRTHTGRPLGSRLFVQQLERDLCRTLAPRPGGRPLRERLQAGQGVLIV